jgi:DNA helicase II / ATP-dependent DNA helicase PcrA
MGYPRWQTAPATTPRIEEQKALLDARAPRSPLAVDPGARTVYRLRPAPVARRGVSERLREMLDHEQLAAVEGAGGRTLVLAAAGSGKTRTIVATLAHLVETGTPAEEIMLVTFTRRAAREMVERAARMSGADLTRVAAGTFHSVCRRILRRYGPLVGLPPAFTVLDGEDQAELLAMARDAVLADREQRPALPRPSAIVGWASLAAESGRPLDDVITAANSRLGDRLDDLGAIVEGYGERKRAMAAVDFADLLVLTARLLEEHPRVLRRLARAYPWVLVDELHDVSPVQARIVETIAAEGGNLVAVADPDQSIYGWRGADPEVVRRFADAPGTRIFPLQTNYRSTPEVVALAQATLPTGNRFGKRLRARRPESGRAPVVAHLASVEDEARFVVQRIADLITAGRSPGEIAVLYRAHHHSVDLQLALAEAGVEFEMFSGARFVESAHVKDVMAFCRLRHNRRDQLAWHRALRLFERVGEATAARIWAQIAATPDPLAAAAALGATPGRSTGIARFAETIGRVAATSRPEEIVLLVARSEWYRDHLQRAYPNWRDREGDLARLAELGSRAASLDRFLGDLQLAERVEADEDVSGPKRTVALSSVHQAKGLEWPVVFVLQVEPGSFPSGWAVSEGGLDEEERLFHVAVTRAADELYLCRPIAARRPWDTGPDAVVINAGQGFLDRDLAGIVEEWSVR